MFTKINNDTYSVDGNAAEKIVAEAKEIVSSISNGEVEQYDVNLNNTLFDSIVSRKVSAYFFKEVNIEVGIFVIARINVGPRILDISLGTANFETGNKRLNGVRYS